jgi:ATP-dependent DNA helicase RecG
MKPIRIFISSVQKEFAAERAVVRDYLKGDPLLRRFFAPFLFEDVPAADRRADELYLDEVADCDLYIGLFGNEYGIEDADGFSATEREFNKATEQGKTRLIYVKGTDDKSKHPKMRALILRAGNELIRRRFNTSEELCSALYASLIDHLTRTGVIQSLPFDEQACPEATLGDLDEEVIREFMRVASNRRGFPLSGQTPINEVLAHLNLIREGRPTWAAVLLFGRQPQRFVSCSEVRCMHFHGTSVQRPAPYYRIFMGTLFEQMDQAVDFVLSKLDVSVGTRSVGNQAPARYELPPEVVREAVVNAVAHRDYTQPEAIQISVFADRLEVWNPGELLPPLTLEKLRKPHRSVTRNARICEALYLSGNIEKYGTGTLMMIRESTGHALPEPDFSGGPGEFSVTLWRDWLTESVLAALNLNDRQAAVIPHLKANRQLTNADYRKLTGATERTAGRDLEEMANNGLLIKTAKTGRGTAYRLTLKPVINPTNQTARKPARKPPNPPSAKTVSKISRTKRKSQP